MDELLRANHHPATSQIGQIPQLLADARQNLVQFDEELDRVRLRLMMLERQRADLREHVLKYESLLSPIRKLPNEVLCHIFQLVCCSKDNPIMIASPSQQSRVPAGSLGAVCAHWRCLSVTAPEIWANLNVNLDDELSSKTYNFLDLVLQRSGVQPLTLQISHWGDHPSNSTGCRLIGQSHRWSDLTLKDCFTVHETADFAGLNLSALRSLSVDIDCDLMLPSDFLVAPCLTSARLEADLRSHTSDIPRHQITALSTFDTNFDQLNTFPNLSTMTLLDLTQDDYSPTEHWTCSSVKSVRVNGGLSNLTLVLGNSTLPSLTGLEYHNSTCRMDQLPVAKFVDFVGRSECAITKLLLHNPVVTSSILKSVFRAVPLLESFSFLQDGDDLFPAEVILKLQARTSQTTLLPKLKELTLELSTINAEYFVDMLKSRWIPESESPTGVACLERVRLTVRKLELEVSTMQLLSKGGMKLVVRDKTGVVLC